MQPGISVAETAALLDRSRSDIIYLIQRGYLRAWRDSTGQWRIDPRRARAYREDESRWISHETAAAATGLSLAVIKSAAAAGHIIKRRHNHSRPSLLYTDVLAFALRREQDRRRKAAIAFGYAMKERARSSAWAAPPDPSGTDPWLPPEVAAIVLKCSASSVRGRARAGRLPATRVGDRWWLRRSHVEIAAAAAAFEITRQARP